MRALVRARWTTNHLSYSKEEVLLAFGALYDEDDQEEYEAQEHNHKGDFGEGDLEQRVMTMKNDVASLQEKWAIKINLKEKITR